jgi:hypothetical protein
MDPYGFLCPPDPRVCARIIQRGAVLSPLVQDHHHDDRADEQQQADAGKHK